LRLPLTLEPEVRQRRFGTDLTWPDPQSTAQPSDARRPRCRRFCASRPRRSTSARPRWRGRRRPAPSRPGGTRRSSLRVRRSADPIRALPEGTPRGWTIFRFRSRRVRHTWASATSCSHRPGFSTASSTAATPTCSTPTSALPTWTVRSGPAVLSTHAHTGPARGCVLSERAPRVACSSRPPAAARSADRDTAEATQFALSTQLESVTAELAAVRKSAAAEQDKLARELAGCRAELSACAARLAKTHESLGISAEKARRLENSQVA
jgi:hypothetical protein